MIDTIYLFLGSCQLLLVVRLYPTFYLLQVLFLIFIFYSFVEHGR